MNRKSHIFLCNSHLTNINIHINTSRIASHVKLVRVRYFRYECAHIRCEMIELNDQVETRCRALAQEVVDRERTALLMQENRHEEEMINATRLRENNMNALLRRVALEQETIRQRFEQKWDSEVADVLKRTRERNSAELNDFASSLRKREIATLRDLRAKHERDTEACRLHYETETDVLSGADSTAMSKLPFDKARFQSEHALRLLDQEDTNNEMRRLLDELEETVENSVKERKNFADQKNRVEMLKIPNHRHRDVGGTVKADVNVVKLSRNTEDAKREKTFDQEE